jgi:hypothetical protein
MSQRDAHFAKMNHCQKSQDPMFKTFTAPMASYKSHGDYIPQGYDAASQDNHEPTV